MTARKVALCFILAALLIAGASSQNLYIRSLMDELIELADGISSACLAGDNARANELSKQLAGRLRGEERLLFSLLEHEYVCKINEQFGLVCAALASDELTDAAASCASLRHELLCIRQLEDVHAENIF